VKTAVLKYTVVQVFINFTFGTGKFHAGFDDRFQAESRWILTLLGNGHQTCMKLTSAECAVENS